MYYNMRVRSAQRALENTRFNLTQRKKTTLQLPEDCIRTLNRALKDVCTIQNPLNIKKICSPVAAVTEVTRALYTNS